MKTLVIVPPNRTERPINVWRAWNDRKARQWRKSERPARYESHGIVVVRDDFETDRCVSTSNVGSPSRLIHRAKHVHTLFAGKRQFVMCHTVCNSSIGSPWFLATDEVAEFKGHMARECWVCNKPEDQ